MPPGAASKGASVDGDNRPSGKPPVIVWSGPGVGGSGGGGPGTGHPTAGTGQFPGLAMGAKGRSKHGRNPSTAESTLSGISAPDSATVDDDNHSTSTTGRHSARETSSSTLADAESQAQAQAAAAAAAAAQEAKDRRRGPAIKVYRRGKDGYMSGTSTPPAAAGAAQRNDEQGVPLKTQMRMSPISASPILLSMPGIGASIAGRRRPDNPVLGLIYDSSRAAERFLLSLGTFDFLFLHLFLSFLPVRLDHLVFCFLSFATLLDRAAMLHEGGQYALLFATLCLIGSLDFLTYSWMRASSMLTTLADIVVYSQFTLHLTSAIPFRRETLPAPVDPSQPTAEEAAAALKSHPNPNFTVFGMTIPHLSISLLWSTVLLTSLSSTLPKSFWARLMQAHIVAASIHGGLRDTVLRYAEMKTELSARVDRVRGERWRDYVGKIGDDNKGDAKSKGLLKSSSANTRTAPGNDTSTTPAASSSASGSRAELLEPPPRPSHGRHGSTSSTLSLPDGTVAAPRTTGNSRVANPSALQRRKGAKGTSRESSKKDLDLSAGARGDGAMVPVKTGGAAVHARRYAAMEDQSSTDPSALYANFYEADDRFELVFRSFVNDPIWRNDSERCDVGWIVPASLKASLYIALKIDGELRKLKQERERESSMAGSSSGPKSKSLKGKKEQALQPTNKVMEELLRAIETEPDSRDPDQGEIRIASGLFVPISRIAVKIDDQSWPRKKWTISADMSHWKSTPPASSDTKYAWWDVDGDEDDMWTPAPVRMSIDVSGLEPAKEHEIKVAVLGFWSVGAKIFLRADPRREQVAPKPAMTYEEQANQLISEAFGHSKPSAQPQDESDSPASSSPFALMTTSALRAHMEKDQEAIKQAEQAMKRLRRDHQRTVNTLKEEVSSLKKTIGKEEASDERNRKRMQVLGEQMENLRLAAESVEDEIAGLRSQLAVEEARREAIGKELKEAKKKKERMERLAASGGGQKQQAEFAELEAQIAQQDKNNKHIQATITKLSTKMVQLKVNREELNTRIAQEREKQAAALLERQRQEALNQSYQPLIEQMKIQVDAVRQQNEATADILNQERAFNDTIRSEMRKLGLLTDHRRSPVERMEPNNGNLPLL